jgi:flagella basal body P-ring formation protein FlgA
VGVLLAIPALACQTIDGDRILGKDLAAASSVFAALDPAAEIGFSPMPGVKRVIKAQDLAALAKRQGISLDGPIGDMCFERPAVTQGMKSQTRIAPAAPEVERGDSVTVEVRSGAARLAFDAKAESSGRAGDSVLVRNPENGHLFQARVEGKGKVLVQR